ncbi:MAG: SDR family NAD(P)-dependent oxidoreductase [Gammaproteobacteria bacterium]|nr:SDR family NAD(P)-dependent oxidoreductase [Gammaproteobacteria bacterium]
MSRIAIITGASSGIGAEFSRQLFSSHDELWLIGRREEKLNQLASELRSRSEVRVIVKILDLSDPHVIENLASLVESESGLETLVNNAGYAEDGQFNIVDWQKHHDLMTVHVDATLRLSHSALKVMTAKGRGSIINVSSVASFVPTPNSTLYGASKSFIRSFSEALAIENKDNEIRIQALCPGFTITDFHEKLGLNPDKFYKKRGMIRSWTSEYVVAESLKDLNKGKVVSVPGWNYKLMVMLLRRLPITLLLWMLGRGDATHRYSE